MNAVLAAQTTSDDDEADSGVNLLVPVDEELASSGTPGGELDVYVRAEGTLEHPLFGTSPFTAEVLHYTADSLGLEDLEHPGTWHPGLAEHVKANSDYTEFRVQLRPDARWHPTDAVPEPPLVVAEDFELMVAMAQSAVEANQSAILMDYQDSVRITVVGPHELLVQWDTPSIRNLDATMRMNPVPSWLYRPHLGRNGVADWPAVARKLDEYAFVGTGPFSYVPGSDADGPTLLVARAREAAWTVNLRGIRFGSVHPDVSFRGAWLE